LFHDLTYAWGFDEVNGNFQENNFGNGGREGDAVQANAQDGAGYNNANMMTPADGQRPRMRMYVWTRSGSVYVDGDLDSGIVVHEYAHGVSNRLTGGPSNVRCLSGGQSGGMGEGWGDCYATTLMQDADSDPMFAWGMGEYAAGRGIRKYPYTRSMEENQHVYEDINPLNQVHAMGCVWCTIIYEVYWELIEQTPFDDDWYTGTGGNNVWANIVTEGMKLQPCTPSFMQARDAILMADEELYDGVHQCAIWRGFAKRGLGVDAQDNSSGGRNNVKNGFSVPPECQEGHGEVGIFDNTAFAK
jgi:extracellular elastinolytic metalloproteinase